MWLEWRSQIRRPRTFKDQSPAQITHRIRIGDEWFIRMEMHIANVQRVVNLQDWWKSLKCLICVSDILLMFIYFWCHLYTKLTESESLLILCTKYQFIITIVSFKMLRIGCITISLLYLQIVASVQMVLLIWEAAYHTFDIRICDKWIGKYASCCFIDIRYAFIWKPSLNVSWLKMDWDPHFGNDTNQIDDWWISFGWKSVEGEYYYWISMLSKYEFLKLLSENYSLG